MALGVFGAPLLRYLPISSTLFHEMSILPRVAVALLGCLLAVRAAPAFDSILDRRASITTLSTSQVDAFTPYTFFASAAYWYVGFEPSLNTVIVAHQGTDSHNILTLLEDADVVLEPLSPSLFPGISGSIEVHAGFAGEQARTAADVLAAVQQAMSQFSTSTVTVVGHSLGGAIALLDSVGNQAFANYVDANLHLTHVNNKEDPVPILPGRFLGFVHPAGEVHIEDSNAWVACPGQDNPSTLCIVGDVSNIFEGDVSDHDGPYNGVTMGC
ncbi:hypothetical protein HWV62_32079 [Athelia sp. TMB]|nr:hypothetical protein HWV62_32079 [Athelia sp. TMB]